MYPVNVLIIVVSVLATKISINTVKCKKCQVKIVSKQTSSVKFSFYRVLELVIRRFKSNVVNPTDILNLLPSAISSRLRLEGATTINDIFRECGPLDNELKWYSFPLLLLLVQRLGDNQCKQELQEYVKTLQTYLQSRSVVSPTSTPTPTKCTTLQEENQGEDLSTNSNTTLTPAIEVFVDQEWDQKLVDPDSNNAQDRAYIAGLLGTTACHIKFIQAVGTQ